MSYEIKVLVKLPTGESVYLPIQREYIAEGGKPAITPVHMPSVQDAKSWVEFILPNLVKVYEVKT